MHFRGGLQRGLVDRLEVDHRRRLGLQVLTLADLPWTKPWTKPYLQ
jgi:hypothetical protein